MRHPCSRISILVVTTLICARVLAAQPEALPGLVVNSADFGIKDVAIELRDPDGQVAAEMTTDTEGTFGLPVDLLRPGYELVLSKRGYDDVSLTLGPQHLVMAKIRIVMNPAQVARPTPKPKPSWYHEPTAQRKRAVELYNEAVELYEEAEDNMEAKAAAIRMMREAASLEPMFPEPLEALTAHAIKTQNWAEVSRLSESLLRIDPKDDNATKNLYVSLVITRHFERVGDAAIRLISLDPEKISYVEQHAHEFFENGNYRMARALFEAITRVAPDMPNGFLNLGVCCAALAERACTISAFETFLELAPDDHPDRDTVETDLANLNAEDEPE